VIASTPAIGSGQGAPIETDALIIGAGPVGLFQVFQLGLLGVKAHLIDALPHPGGQCAELYPDKPIYDIPGIAVCTGQDLTDRLLQQIAPLGATFHYGHTVSTLDPQPDGRFRVASDRGPTFLTKTVFIAAGVGAFLPRTLKLPALDPFERTQLFYRIDTPEHFAGKDVLVVGGDDAALEAALQLCPGHGQDHGAKAKSVTLLHRRAVLQGTDANLAAFDALRNAAQLRFMVGQIQSPTQDGQRLTGVQILDAEGAEQHVAIDTLLVRLGLSPKLGPVAQWGLAMERKQLAVDTETYATSVPGIFAVGDVNTYPGKKKLIVCGFHECVLAAYGAMPVIFPGKTVHLEYTTSSARLHAVLGVA
jgi:thioredoxin reductase (NADPH)